MTDNNTTVPKTEEQTPLPTDESIEGSLREKLKSAIALKDYAINSNLDVADDIIKKLNDAQSSNAPAKYASDIDTAIRDLTAITFPTTIETLRMANEQGGLNRSARNFMIALLIIGPAVLLLAIWSIGQGIASQSNPIWHSLIAACLGFLGSLVYIFFNLIGIMAEKAFSRDDTYANSVRLILGAIVGWVFFYAFVQSENSSTPQTPALLFLPFAAGYSTRLVVGLINQVIRAIELTLGLEEKSSTLLRRKSKSKPS